MGLFDSPELEKEIRAESIDFAMTDLRESGVLVHSPGNISIGMWEEEQNLLLSLLSRIKSDHIAVCEIGSNNGCAAQLMRFFLGYVAKSSNIYCVDPNFTDWFDLLNKRVDSQLDSRPHKITKVTDFSNSLDKYEIEPLDFVLIDGLHAFRQVLTDFNVVKPHLKPDSIIAFHDVSPRLQKAEKRQEILKWTLENLDYLKGLDYEDFMTCEAYCYLESTEPVEHIDCSVDCYHPQETGLTSWIRGKTSPHSAIAAFRFKG